MTIEDEYDAMMEEGMIVEQNDDVEFLEAVGSIDNEKTKNIIMSYTMNQIKDYKQRVLDIINNGHRNDIEWKIYMKEELEK